MSCAFPRSSSCLPRCSPQQPAELTLHVRYSAKDRVYRNRDEINVSKEGLGDLYETKLKGFFSCVLLLFKKVDGRADSSSMAESTFTRTRRSATSRRVRATSTSEVRFPYAKLHFHHR